MSIGACGSESRSLLRETRRSDYQRGFHSCLQRLFCNADEFLQLFDFVVSGLDLDCNFILNFFQVELGFGEQGLRVFDGRNTLSSIEEVITERNPEGAKVVDEQGNAALVAVSCEAGDVRNVGIFRCGQDRLSL